MILIITGVDKVYAIDVNYSSCIVDTGQSTTTNCNVATNKQIIGNYVNVATSYPANLGQKTYQFSLYYDLHFIDQGNLDGEYVRTPKVNIYINGTRVNVITNTTFTQRAWCDSGQLGCWRIRTFLTSFQWTGNLSSANVTWNIVSQTGNSGTGWAVDPSDATHSIGPYFTFGQQLTAYADDTQQAIENMNESMNQGFTSINENNNRLTESINTTTTNKANDIIANQNTNNQALQDKIDETYNECLNYNYNNEPIGIQNKFLNETGLVLDLTGNNVSEYIPITADKTYTLSVNYSSAQNGRSYCIYDKMKTKLSCERYTQATFSITPLVDGYIRYTINTTTTALTTTFTGQYCYNRLDGKPYQGITPNTNKQDQWALEQEDLLDLYNDDQLDIIDLSIDTDGSNWVWARITQFLNTNEYIRLMFISICSLGIIKLVLAR